MLVFRSTEQDRLPRLVSLARRVRLDGERTAVVLSGDVIANVPLDFYGRSASFPVPFANRTLAEQLCIDSIGDRHDEAVLRDKMDRLLVERQVETKLTIFRFFFQ